MEIVNGYNRKCKDSLAGVKKIWICKYQKYNRSQIIIDSNYLITFPDTFIYSFHSVEPSSLNESQEQSEGGKFYNQNISLIFKGADAFELELLNYLNYRILILDNNGLYRILGLYNGLESSGITYETGQSKNSLNGFRISFTGREEKGSFFIENLLDSGFIESNPFEFNLLFENNNFFLLENNDNLITQNG